MWPRHCRGYNQEGDLFLLEENLLLAQKGYLPCIHEADLLLAQVEDLLLARDVSSSVKKIFFLWKKRIFFVCKKIKEEDPLLSQEKHFLVVEKDDLLLAQEEDLLLVAWEPTPGGFLGNRPWAICNTSH